MGLLWFLDRPTVRFSDRANLSSEGFGILTVGLRDFSNRTARCSSRFSTQSVPVPIGRRCTHWSDGAESHAYGRALMHSSHVRLHPDHRLHLDAQIRCPGFLSSSVLDGTCADAHAAAAIGS